MLNSPAILGLCAILATAVVLASKLFKHRKLERKDTGSVFVALSAGFSLPKGLFLASYLFDPDPPNTITKLHGFENEIFAAGIIIAFLAIVSVWSLCEES